MTYKTINLTPETYEQLLLYKHGRMTFNEVLKEIMKIVPEEKFYKHILEEHHKRVNKMKEGEFIKIE